MKLSVLISMYNAEKHIGNCLESLINQNLSINDYEIILMDDGSTDNSFSIAKNYAEKYSNIILYSQKNAGLYTTRNRLLKLAKGEYIYNLDSDDYIVYNCLNQLLSLAQDDQLDIIGFDTLETSSVELYSLSKPIDSETVEICSGVEFIENCPQLRHEIWWYFIKREFMLEHELTFNKNEYNADVVYTIKALLSANKVGYLPVSIHRYVQTQDSLMRSDNIEIILKRLEYMQLMIINKSNLITNLENNDNSTVLIDNLKHRRDIFTFFNIIGLVRNRFNLDFVKSKINQFKKVDAYPIYNFNKFGFNTIMHRVILKIVNSEKTLYSLIYLKNLFVKTIK